MRKTLQRMKKELNPPENLLCTFGNRSNTNKEYDFNEDIEWLQFQINLGNDPFTKQNQDWLFNLAYDNQQIFSLHDKDLDNKLTHTITSILDCLFVALNNTTPITR